MSWPTNAGNLDAAGRPLLQSLVGGSVELSMKEDCRYSSLIAAPYTTCVCFSVVW